MNQFLASLPKNIAGYVAIALVILGGAYWYFAPEDEREVYTVARGEFVQEVSASGRVKPAQTVTLGFSQSGRVSRVNVSVGDLVKEGDLLASIENGDVRASLLQKEAALASQKAKLAELQEGTRPEEVAVTEAEVANKAAAFSQAQQSLVESVQDGYVEAHNTLFNKIDPFVLNPRSTAPQILVSIDEGSIPADFSKERARIEQLFLAWQPITNGISGIELVKHVGIARQNLAALVDFLAFSANALNRAVPTASYPSSAIVGSAADVAAGRTAINAALSGLTTAETNFRSAETALTTAERTLALKRAGTTETGIAGQVAQVRAAEAEVAAASALLRKTEIRAPFDGTVTAVDAKVGESMGGTETAVSLIGEGSLEIESFVPEINIALLSVGDPARITLDAYGEAQFPARVQSIDPAETVRDGVSTYRVILGFDQPDERVRSGMTANVIITTDFRSGVISIPQGLIHGSNGVRSVRVLAGGIETERAVTTGAVSSLGNIEITSGLSEGEVLLIPE